MKHEKSVSVVRVGIIGAGGIAEAAHMPGYVATPGVKVVAVCDTDPARARAFAQKYAIPAVNVFTDHEQLVTMDDLDAVSVCTPNNFHVGPAIAALRAGRHVLCEKPIAGCARDGERMVEAARESGKILQIGLHKRFLPQSVVLKTLIERGELGRLYFARVVAARRRGIPSWGAFVRKSVSGGGPLVDIGVHELDLVVWLMGSPKPLGAVGRAWTMLGNQRGIATGDWGPWDVEHYDVEDFAAAYISFEGGIAMTLETCWAAHVGDPGPSYILGDRGGAQHTPLKIFRDHEGNLVDVQPPTPRALEDPHTTQIKAFIRAIREGLPSPVPGEQALEITRIFDAVYESTRTGALVPLDGPLRANGN